MASVCIDAGSHVCHKHHWAVGHKSCGGRGAVGSDSGHMGLAVLAIIRHPWQEGLGPSTQRCCSIIKRPKKKLVRIHPFGTRRLGTKAVVECKKKMLWQRGQMSRFGIGGAVCNPMKHYSLSHASLAPLPRGAAVGHRNYTVGGGSPGRPGQRRADGEAEIQQTAAERHHHQPHAHRDAAEIHRNARPAWGREVEEPRGERGRVSTRGSPQKGGRLGAT